MAGAAKPAAQPKDDPNDPGTPKTIDQFGGAKAEKRTLNLHAHQWKGNNEAEIAAFTGGKEGDSVVAAGLRKGTSG